jgi:hypothetical protein
MKTTIKKGVMSEVIGVFILVLVVSVLAGMTFMFVGSLKSQVALQSDTCSTGYTYNSSASLCSNATASISPVGRAWLAVNSTEGAGATIVNYLPLLFLAIIFGAILAVVLKIILPYINLGNQVGGF